MQGQACFFKRTLGINWRIRFKVSLVMVLLSLFTSLSTFSAEPTVTRYDINNTTDYPTYVWTSTSSVPRNKTIYNGKLYFSAFSSPLKNDNRLMSFDAESKTLEIVNTDIEISKAPKAIINFQNTLFFIGTSNDSVEGIYSYDESTKKTNIAAIAAQASHLFVYNNKLYFTSVNEATGRELWVYDPTTQNSELVFDINQGNDSGFFNDDIKSPYFTVYNGQLYFFADDGISGYSLWQYNENSNSLRVFDSVTAYPTSMAVFQNKLYFTATESEYGTELWAYSSDENEITLAVDVISGSTENGDVISSTPKDLTVFNEELYFVVNHSAPIEELWKFNGIAASYVTNFNPSGEGSRISNKFHG